MFREDDFRYLCWFVALDLGLTALSLVYEIIWGTGDSIFKVAIATVRWQGVVIPTTLTIIGVVEVIRVLASRIIARDKEKAREEERRFIFEADRQRKDNETLEEAVARLEAQRKGK